MIDKIEIRTQERLDWTENRLFEDMHKTDENTIKGHIKNIKIFQNISGCVLQGSIAKYLNDENITPLTIEQCKQAVLLLQEDTGLDFSGAIIKSLEIGTSLILKHEVLEYLSLFGFINNSKYKRVETSTSTGLESLSYGTKTGGFSFSCYDKIQEMKDKHKQDIIPNLYQGSNVLRLELKVLKRQAIRGLFGKDLTPLELYEKDTVSVLKKQFATLYNSIQKMGRNIYIDTSKNLTPAKLEEYFAECYRQENPKEYTNRLSLLKAKGNLTGKNYERITAKNRHFKGLSEKNGLIIELEEKLCSRGFL